MTYGNTRYSNSPYRTTLRAARLPNAFPVVVLIPLVFCSVAAMSPWLPKGVPWQPPTGASLLERTRSFLESPEFTGDFMVLMSVLIWLAFAFLPADDEAHR